MRVQIATQEDTGALYRLLDSARHIRLAMGNEDLTAAITAGRVLLLKEDERTPQEPSAMLVTLAEERPPSLPAAAPERVYVRGVAFQPHLSPTVGMQQLLQAFTRRHANAAHPLQLIAYGGAGWLDRALRDAGMALADRVQYFALERLQTRTWLVAPAPCTITEAAPADLSLLAEIDARAFDPLWHYTQRNLQEALFSGPLLAARVAGAPAGYIALLLDRTTCTIARLAVHPDWQGQGIGRALLLTGLRQAQAWGCSRALLNTQTTNHRSQQLYSSLGFRPTGESFSVFVLDLPGALTHPAAVEAASTNK